MTDAFVFTRLHLPRPLNASTVAVLLMRLAASDVPRPIVFEVSATADRVAATFGCAKTAVQRLKRSLSAGIPGLQFEAATRPDVATVGRIAVRPGGLPLAEGDPEEFVAALYDALAARRGDEVVAVQMVLGRAHSPARVPAKTADPLQPLGSRLLDGALPADRDVRPRLVKHAAQVRFDVTLRIGVRTDSVKRRRALLWEVFGTLQQLESPGVRLSLMRDSPARWASAATGGRVRLGVAELVPLLAWPLGERDYPGVPNTHPRLLPVPEIVSRAESVFAAGTAPRPDRPIGLDPLSRLQHFIAIGPTGSGKSTLFEHMILSDINAGRAVCVVEPKKQLIDRILATAPADAAERIVVLDATDLDAPVGFNPLDVGDRDPDIVVDGVLAVLAAVFADGWGPRTEYLIQGALLSLARAGQKRPDPYTLIDLPRLLTDTGFRRPVVAAVQDDVTLAAFWAEFEDMRPAQRAAAIASPLNKLRKLVMRKPLVAILGQPRPQFRLRDIFRERKVVLVPLNDALIGTGASRLLGSLVVAELWMATLERVTEKDPMKRPGMVFVDEVQNYLSLPTPIPDVLSTSRSYGVAWHLAHQYRDQLPPALRSALDVNARSKVCFTLEPDDARDYAKMTSQLVAEDFQTLPKHHIYARLLGGGTLTEWCSARTLPPAPDTGDEQFLRQESRRRYGALPPAKPTSESARTTASVDAARTATHQKARRP